MPQFPLWHVFLSVFLSAVQFNSSYNHAQAFSIGTTASAHCASVQQRTGLYALDASNTLHPHKPWQLKMYLDITKCFESQNDSQLRTIVPTFLTSHFGLQENSPLDPVRTLISLLALEACPITYNPNDG